MPASRAEVLGFIAAHEPLAQTLERFPEIDRGQLRALLRQAAVLMAAEDQAVPLAPAPPAPPPQAPAAAQASVARPEERSARVLRVFSDGAARGNPGPAGAGAVISKSDGSVVARCGKYLGIQTNNHAEYVGLLLGLETALKLGAEEVEVFADSELLVRQLKGVYRVKSPTLKPLHDQAKELLKRFRRVQITHVPREQNQLADEMSNRAIDEKM